MTSPNDVPVPIIHVIKPWTISISTGERQVSVSVRPADEVAIIAEHYERLPLFDAVAPGWRKGERLRGVVTEETTAMGALVPQSVVLSSAPEGGALFVLGRDYELDPDWGTFGRLPGSAIGSDTPVYATYRHGLSRIDAVVVERDGTLTLREGTPAIRLSRPPAIAADEVHIANIWIPAGLRALDERNMFPITERAFPTAPAVFDERLLPRTMRKLHNGDPLTILAWGDSVTVGSYLASPDERWQVQFVRRLHERFPAAKITLVTEAWDGHTTVHYLLEPPGALHNYRERVLAVQPDLVVSEFVNDAGLPVDETAERYRQLLADFGKIEAEWIILTPHYVRPDWMDLTHEKYVDDDPRPYVAFLRRFAAEHVDHGVALADAAQRWGRLWRQGIPYTTLLTNAINHPDPRGMRLFADALLGE
jgi:lysophospholipase L1-like esterase